MTLKAGRGAAKRSPRLQKNSAPVSRRRYSARPVLPDTLSYVTGLIGILGSHARDGERRAGQSPARRVGTLVATARSRDRDKRFRLMRQLVRARLNMRRDMMCSLSGGLASMGAAVPYAIAAKFAHPTGR
jgi:hypothetical protein